MKIKFALIGGFLFKLSVSGVTYLYILISTRVGMELYEYMLMGPFVIIFSLVTDRGRSDSILADKYDLALIRKVPNEFYISLIFCMVFSLINAFVESKFAFLVLSIILQGVLQGYLDIFLKGSVVAYKSQSELLKYQFLVSFLILFLCVLCAINFLTARVTISLISLSSCLGIFLFPKLHPSSVISALERSYVDQTVSSLKVMSIVKLTPPAVYMALYFFGNIVGGVFGLIFLRCIYFVFGFLQISIASEKIKISKKIFRIFLLFFVPAIFLSIPIFLISNKESYNNNVSLAWDMFLVALCSVSFVYMFFIYSTRILKFKEN